MMVLPLSSIDHQTAVVLSVLRGWGHLTSERCARTAPAVRHEGWILIYEGCANIIQILSLRTYDVALRSQPTVSHQILSIVNTGPHSNSSCLFQRKHVLKSIPSSFKVIDALIIFGIPSRRWVLIDISLDGVMTAKKDMALPKHGEFPDVPNLHVLKLLQSLKSRGYVTEKFSWQWFYWRLTDEGIEYLREYLHLPASIVPSTFKKAVPTRAPAFGGDRDRGFGGDRQRGFGGPRMDRDGYRGPKKMGDAPANFNPESDGSRRPYSMRGGRGGFRGVPRRSPDQ